MGNKAETDALNGGNLETRVREALAKIEEKAAKACPPGRVGHSDQIPYEICAEYVRAALGDENDAPQAAPACEHYWAWVGSAGTSRSARICQLCHQPDARWLNHTAEFDQPDRHVAVGRLVPTIIGNDGVRWACETCDETVYERGGEWFHFDKRRDPIPPEKSTDG